MSDQKKSGFDIDLIDLPTSVSKAPAPVAKAPEESVESIAGDIIENILKKMRRKGDFPSFSRQIIEVNRILKLKYASARDIADVISKDISLSQKLLKLVNSSFYTQFSLEGVTTISQAMIILGADYIQQAAASLMLFEHMQSNSQTNELKDVTIGTFMSGLLAKNMAKRLGYRNTEDFQISAMFHNLGENLIIFYCPDEYKKINKLIQREEMDREQASRKVLGLSYQELSTGVARKWGLPEDIIKSMQESTPPEAHQSSDVVGKNNQRQYIAAFSNEICRINREMNGPQKAVALASLTERYKNALSIDRNDVSDLMDRAVEKLSKHSKHLNINVKRSKLLRKIGATEGEAAEAVDDIPEDSLVIDGDRIKAAIDDIRQKMRREFQINEIMRLILDAMMQEFDFDRVAICIKDMKNNRMPVRFAMGDNAETLKQTFNFDIEKSRDVFNLALTHETDYVINDVRNPKNRAIIPEWYRVLKLSAAFVALPIIVNHVPMGLFYADRMDPGRLDSIERQDYLKKLRNLAVRAIRLKSAAKKSA